MIEYAPLIVLLPLISAIVIFFFGRWLPLRGALIGILVMGFALIQSLGLLYHCALNPGFIKELSLTWFQFSTIKTELGFVIDGLSSLMLVIVTLVSFLVQVYSLGYMHGDPRFKRYYSYLSFFTFSMLLLVVANNFLQIFIGWELVGLASYLLIGFWFEKESAASAGRKAFITTKVGDIGFFLGIMSLFFYFKTLNFNEIQTALAGNIITPQICGIIALLLFCGAIGKSAQVPLHIWLPDAMEGPTPVSALIHAATMVAAGVYMVARIYFMFHYGAFSLEVVAWFGMVTAFLAATMALVSTDIKRVLAFSTVSQLGYMVLAMGVGGRTAGMYHLTTHAFFKALLFLGAGSVIHAVHTNDIQKMGGLSKKMVWTFWTFTFAWLAISGVWPFAGFFSKDAILEEAMLSGHIFLFWGALFVAFLTAFYMTRLYLLVFITPARDKHIYSHAHESPKSMVLPLVVLAFLSLVSGYLLKDSIHLLVPALDKLGTVPEGTVPNLSHGHHWFVPVISSLFALGGISLSFLFYFTKMFSAEKIAATFPGVYQLLLKKYGFDEFYIQYIIRPADFIAGTLYHFDDVIFDQKGVDGVGVLTDKLSVIQDWFDRNIIDKLVDLWGDLAQRASLFVKRFQTGLVQNYIFFVVLGFGALVFWQLKLNVNDFLNLF